MNPFTDESRDVRWKVSLPEVNLDQLRAPASLDWLRTEGKPADRSLSTHLLKTAFDAALIAAIVAGRYDEVMRRLVTTWPELVTAVTKTAREAVVVTNGKRGDDGHQQPRHPRQQPLAHVVAQ